GTNAAINFLGTTDNIGLRICTNNAPRYEFTTTGALQAIVNGTAAAPAYRWTTDQDICLSRAGANTFYFSTADEARMRLFADGRVTINSATPNNSRLYVIGTGNTAGIFAGLNVSPGFAVWGSNDNNTGTGIAGRGQNPVGGTTYLVNGSGG